VTDDPTELAESCVFLVRHIVKGLPRAMREKLGAEDLVSAGNIGLMRAAHAFDGSRGYNFATFAGHRIRGSILDYNRAVSGRVGSARQQARFVNTRALAEHAADEPEPERWPEEMRRELRVALAKLGRRDREILELSFGLDGADPLTPPELAERTGLSRGYALQLRSNALKRLREHLDPTAAGGHA
jgi:RNA polymerase sporulation-specific sigma factor